MKIYIFILLLSFFTCNIVLNAQKRNNINSIEFGANFGTHRGINIYYTLKPDNSKLIFSSGFVYVTKIGRLVPNDYVGGSILGSKNSSKPHERVSSFELLGGKEYWIDENLLNVQVFGGFSYTVINLPDNFVKQHGGAGWVNLGLVSSSNYSYDRVLVQKLGIILNPRLSILLSDYLAINVASYSNFNSYRNMYTFQLGLALGNFYNY